MGKVIYKALSQVSPEVFSSDQIGLRLNIQNLQFDASVFPVITLDATVKLGDAVRMVFDSAAEAWPKELAANRFCMVYARPRRQSQQPGFVSQLPLKRRGYAASRCALGWRPLIDVGSMEDSFLKRLQELDALRPPPPQSDSVLAPAIKHFAELWIVGIPVAFPKFHSNIGKVMHLCLESRDFLARQGAACELPFEVEMFDRLCPALQIAFDQYQETALPELTLRPLVERKHLYQDSAALLFDPHQESGLGMGASDVRKTCVETTQQLQYFNNYIEQALQALLTQLVLKTALLESIAQIEPQLRKHSLRNRWALVVAQMHLGNSIPSLEQFAHSLVKPSRNVPDPRPMAKLLNSLGQKSKPKPKPKAESVKVHSRKPDDVEAFRQRLEQPCERRVQLSSEVRLAIQGWCQTQLKL